MSSKYVILCCLSICMMVGCSVNTDTSPHQNINHHDTPVSDKHSVCDITYWNQATLTEIPVKGRLYLDQARKGYSKYERGGVDPTSSEVEGLSDVEVKLHLKDKVITTKTCPDGRYAFSVEQFPELKTANQGFLEFPRTDCTTNNCATNWTKKINRQQSIKMLVWGDSIASFPLKLTDHRIQWFPEKFKLLANNVVDIDLVNVAVPGSKTSDWIEGGVYYDKMFRNVIDVDIIVLTIGGNDILLDVIKNKIGLPIEDIRSEVKKGVDRAVQNVHAIIDKIRDVNQNADILLVTYFDYSDYFFVIQQMSVEKRRNEVKRILSEGVRRHRKEIAGYKGVQLVDVLGRVTTPYPDNTYFDVSSVLLSDTIHLNEKGHTFHSRQLYEALGGWVAKDPTSLLKVKRYGDLRYIGYPSK